MGCGSSLPISDTPSLQTFIIENDPPGAWKLGPRWYRIVSSDGSVYAYAHSFEKDRIVFTRGSKAGPPLATVYFDGLAQRIEVATRLELVRPNGFVDRSVVSWNKPYRNHVQTFALGGFSFRLAKGAKMLVRDLTDTQSAGGGTHVSSFITKYQFHSNTEYGRIEVFVPAHPDMIDNIIVSMFADSIKTQQVWGS